MSDQMTDQELIELHGGVAKVAEMLGENVTRQRVQNWKKRGIPSKVKLTYPHLFIVPTSNIVKPATA